MRENQQEKKLYINTEIMKVGTQFDYLLKVIMIGDAGVGKSCLVAQFINGRVDLNQESTIGIEFASKNIIVSSKVLKLQIWDTAGQENFRSLTRSYYRNVIGALLVYDVTRQETFDYLQQWIHDVHNNGNPQIEIILIGNKNDLEQDRKVAFEEGEAFAQKNGMKFFETSAKDYQQVQHAFSGICTAILEKIKKGKINQNTVGVKYSPSEELKIDSGVKKPKKNCCWI